MSAWKLNYVKESDNLAKRAQFSAGNPSAGIDQSDSAYPLSNIIQLPVSKPGRIKNQNSTEGMLLQVVYSGAVSIDTIALVGHNITSGATITIYGGTTFNPSTNLGTMTWRRGTLYKEFSSAQSYRYWKIAILDEANEHGFTSIGYFIMANSTAITFGYYDYELSDHMIGVRRFTDTGTPLNKHLTERQSMALRFENRTQAEANVVRSVFTDLKGPTNPVLIIPSPDQNEAVFGRFGEEDFRQRYVRAPEPLVGFDVDISGDAYGINVVDSLPELTAGEALPDGWTFARTSTAYYKNSDLELVSAASGEYRHTHYWDYGLYGALVEGAAGTQLHTYTEDLSNAAWTKGTSVTISANSANEPVETPTGLMDGIVENNGVTQGHEVRQSITITADADACAAVYARPGTRDWVRILIAEAADINNHVLAYFNVSTGVVGTEQNGGTGSGVRAYIERMTDGVYRCCVAGNVGNSATAITVRYHPGTADGTVSYAGDSSAPAIYLWGMHAQQAGWPSSYIPRLDATAATRAADSLYYDFSPARAFEPMTALVDGVEIGWRYDPAATYQFQVGQAGGATGNPRWYVYSSSSYINTYFNSAGTVTTATRTHQAIGSRVTHRHVIYPEGAALQGMSVNGAAETVSAKGTVRSIDGTYNRLQIAASTAGTSGSPMLLRRLRIARGVQSLEIMQRL
jgi:hypothetical protein